MTVQLHKATQYYYHVTVLAIFPLGKIHTTITTKWQ